MTMRRAFALATSMLAVLGATFATAIAAPLHTQTVAGAQIAAVADRIAHATLNDTDRAVAPAFQIVDQNVPEGVVAIAAAGAPQMNATYISVPIAINVDGKLARTVFAGYRVTAYVRTAVAAHDLSPGAVLSEADVTIARVPSQGRPGVEPAALVGRKIRSATARGTTLYVEATTVNELVKAGQPAILVVRDGSVALTADVVARTGGGLGDTVAVFNQQTRKALSGVVTGPNQVELVLPGVTE